MLMEKALDEKNGCVDFKIVSHTKINWLFNCIFSSSFSRYLLFLFFPGEVWDSSHCPLIECLLCILYHGHLEVN